MKKLSILWASCHALHDTSNGASLSMRAMLAQLQANLYNIYSINTYIFSTKSGISILPPEAKDIVPMKTFSIDSDGIHHNYMCFSTTVQKQMHQMVYCLTRNVG